MTPPMAHEYVSISMNVLRTRHTTFLVVATRALGFPPSPMLYLSMGLLSMLSDSRLSKRDTSTAVLVSRGEVSLVL